MKIGQKLTLGFVGLMLLIGWLGYFTLRTSQTALKETLGKSVSDLSEQILDNIDKNIYQRIEEVQAYATDELVLKYISISNSQFEKMADPNSYIAQIDKDWGAGVDLPIISELAHNELAKELQAKQAFYKTKYGYPLLAEIFVTNKFGVNVAQTNKTTDYYQADEEWWQAAKKDGLFVSDVNYDKSSGTFSPDIAVRINDANGNFAGVIKVVPNIKETINMLNEAKLAAEYKTLQLHLIDHNGKIIYSTKDHKIGQNTAGWLDNCITNANSKKENLYMIDKNGHFLATAKTKKIKNISGLEWTLATEIDTAEIFTQIISLRNTMLLTGLVVMSLALLACSVIYRSVAVPITELQEATIQIANGNLDTNLAKAGSGQINQLANSFQRMAERLKKTISDLNDEINGRKKIEEKLRENQRFLNDIFNSIQDGIGIMDKDLNIVMVNPWIADMHPQSKPLTGKKCFAAYHNRNSPCPECPCAETLKTGIQHSVTIPNPCSKRPDEWISIVSFPLNDHKGNITGVIEYVRDVTEERKAKELLSERTEQIMHHHNTLLKLANIPEQDLDSLWRLITEQNAEVINVSQVSIWFYNRQRTEIVSRDMFIKPQNTHESGISLKIHDYPQYFKAMENCRILAANDAQTDLRTCEFAESYLRPKGISSMIDVPIRLHGQIIGIICHEHIGPAREWTNAELDFAASVADMISLKLEAAEHSKAEQAIEKLNKDLETAVRELSISNRQLHDFVHVAAHDLKTPVRGIGTLADWIISDYGNKLDNQGCEQVRLLKNRVVRIDKLIDGMLQFSKIVRTKHKEKQVNLNVILSDIKDTIPASDRVEIAVDTLPTIICEHEHIELIFQNLLTNAVIFMDKTKGRVKVGCVEQGDFWKFYVCDNGPGIEQKYYEKIFRIFQTLPKNDEPDTTGIGLAIVKKIVELYSGKIWVESQPGSGSTFYFTFPKKTEEISYAAAKTNTAC